MRKHAWLAIPFVLIVAFALFWWFSPWHRGLEEKGFALLPPDALFAVHLDLASLRNNASVQRLIGQVSPRLESDYADFIKATGFDWERDLDTVDVAIAGPPDQRVINAVLAGRYHREKIDAYLAPRRKSSTFHSSINIDEFTGPSGRPLRIAFLGSGRLLFSNAPGPQPITRMVELSRRSGECLGDRLRALDVFAHLPRGSQLWASADLERGAQVDVPAPGSDASFTSDLLKGSRMALASATLTSQQVELRLQAEYTDGAAAERVARGLAGLRSLLKALAERRNASDSTTDWQKMLDQVAVSQNGPNVAVNLKLDAGLFERLLTLH